MPREIRHSLQLVWAALWRAQVSHLLVFVVFPAVVMAVRLAIGVTLLPFMLLSIGHRTANLPPEFQHLRSPSCWLALAPCSFAETTIVSLPVQARSSTAAVDPEPEPFLPIPKDLNVRHLWFAVWLLWFIVFLALRDRRKGAVT